MSLKKVFKEGVSLNKSFVITFASILLVILLLTGFWVNYLIKYEIKQDKRALSTLSQKVEFIFSDSIVSIEGLAKYIGEKIIDVSTLFRTVFLYRFV